jgi:Cu/Ag efflux pump CusA
MLSGVSAAVAIKIFGSDLSVLREKAQEVSDAIAETNGLVDLRIEQQGLIPQLKIYVLREEAAKFGLSSGDVTSMLEAAFNGEVVTHVLEETKLYEVFFQFDQDSRSSIDKMKETVLKIMPDGRKILVKDIADVYETTGPNEINRENGLRRIVISANTSGRDLGSLMDDIQAKIKQEVNFDEGYYVVYGGQFESQQAATRKILLFSLISFLGILFVLYSHFSSKMITAQIMITIPLAYMGGILLLFLSDRSITVASLVGFITLSGIASRNSIMMISHYLYLMKHEGETFTKEMIIRGSQERLIPVLMTASVTALALLPLVFAKGQPGSEILHPVAVVIVGGLISSTLLDILVTPVLFYKFGKTAAEKYIIKSDSEKII